MSFESPQKESVPNPKWVVPNFFSTQERGELERVAKTFSPDNPDKIIQLFNERLNRYLMSV